MSECNVCVAFFILVPVDLQVEDAPDNAVQSVAASHSVADEIFSSLVNSLVH